MSKHTPKPWHVRALPIDGTITEHNGDKYTICDDHDHFIAAIKSQSDETYGNAHLISAAPELLEALKKAVEIIESEPEAYGIYKAHIEQFNSAIKKAEG